MAEILNEWTRRRANSSLREAASRAEATELAAQIASYEALKSAGGLSLGLTSLEDLGRALVKARIAKGWTQARLAQELNMPKQQIQRYETTGYTSASLRRLVEVAKALDLRFAATIEAGLPADRDYEVARTLAGYAAAEAVQRVERRLRLEHMSSKEARRIFDELCDTYYQLAPLHRESANPMSPGIEHRLAMRRAMEVLSGKRGLA